MESNLSSECWLKKKRPVGHVKEEEEKEEKNEEEEESGDNPTKTVIKY